MWAQEVCEPDLNSEEEGSILLSMFPGFSICCTEFCGCSDARRRCCLLLPSRCSRAEELWGRPWLRWLAFELTPGVCGLPWKRRRLIKMSSHSTMNNNTLPVQKLNMVLVGSWFLCSHPAEALSLSQCSRHRWTNMYWSWIHTKEWAGNEEASSNQTLAALWGWRWQIYEWVSELQVCI